MFPSMQCVETVRKIDSFSIRRVEAMSLYGQHKRKLVAIAACRNGGSRLYAKPLQRLDVEANVTLLGNLVEAVKTQSDVAEIVIAASDDVSSRVFGDVASALGVRCVFGDEYDVMGRMIKAAETVNGTDILRLSSESPFPYLASLRCLWRRHCQEGADATFLDEIIDGCGIEILNVESLKKVHPLCAPHELEHCSQYHRKNRDDFRILRETAEVDLCRKDLRLTVDFPEDLIVCREIYRHFKAKGPLISIYDIIEYLDCNDHLIDIIKPFTVDGYESMYKWG